VDTRSKLLSLEAAKRLQGPLTLATGYFDVLCAEDARELAQAGRPLLVAVVQNGEEIWLAEARAEMVAALRVVDYVVAAGHDDLDELIESLRPARVLRLEEGQARRAQRLIEDVQRNANR